jgi:hypothetical protein
LASFLVNIPSVGVGVTFSDAVLDGGLSVLDTMAEWLRISKAEPTTFAEAVTPISAADGVTDARPPAASV